MRNNLPQEIIQDDNSLKEYLKANWVIGMMLQLEQARKSAGLSQEGLAQVLSRKQSVISRTERDLEGAMSLNRYADWLFACNAIPHDIEITSVAEARRNLMEQMHKGQDPPVKVPDLSHGGQSLADARPVLTALDSGEATHNSHELTPDKNHQQHHQGGITAA